MKTKFDINEAIKIREKELEVRKIEKIMILEYQNAKDFSKSLRDYLETNKELIKIEHEIQAYNSKRETEKRLWICVDEIKDLKQQMRQA